jgi:type I restriction enzyme M protein
LSQANYNLSKLEIDNWDATNHLHANSKLTAAEYSMLVLGLNFLRHATTRFAKTKAEIESTVPIRRGVPSPLSADHFKGKAAIYLPKEAHYDYLVDLHERFAIKSETTWSNASALPRSQAAS